MRIKKIHYHKKYTYPDRGIHFITMCGRDNFKQEINSTIIEDRVNCKKCLQCMSA
jgi:hypothetical protein